MDGISNFKTHQPCHSEHRRTWVHLAAYLLLVITILAGYAEVFHALLARSIALAPSAYEIGFISMAHSRDDIDRFAATLGHVLNDVSPQNTGETYDSQA